MGGQSRPATDRPWVRVVYFGRNRFRSDSDLSKVTSTLNRSLLPDWHREPALPVHDLPVQKHGWADERPEGMQQFLGSVQFLEKEALEQKHSHKVQTDRSDGAHECDGERDAEVECAGVAIPACRGFLPLGTAS